MGKVNQLWQDRVDAIVEAYVHDVITKEMFIEKMRPLFPDRFGLEEAIGQAKEVKLQYEIEQSDINPHMKTLVELHRKVMMLSRGFDLNDAVGILQDFLGIESGDIAGVVFCGIEEEDWSDMSVAARRQKLFEYMSTEAMMHMRSEIEQEL